MSKEKFSLNAFLERNKITKNEWDSFGIQWARIQDIAADHDSKIGNLNSCAQHFANDLQSFPEVHSVRWRIKDPWHLAEKIVRKIKENSKKYSEIDKNNYREIVKDLIGLRAIHLFKHDAVEIDRRIVDIWDMCEKPIVYKREGDDVDFHFSEKDYFLKNHESGYRSIHYIIKSAPAKKTIYAEIQVRTIFEEGWSEVDHSLRYPNFSDEKYVKSVLATLNRLSGSADEMATLAYGLSNALEEFKLKINELQSPANLSNKNLIEQYLKNESGSSLVANHAGKQAESDALGGILLFLFGAGVLSAISKGK